MAREDTSWDITPRDIKKAITQEKYEDDCLACKVTGADIASPSGEDEPKKKKKKKNKLHVELRYH